jgi:hypothetical protein
MKKTGESQNRYEVVQSRVSLLGTEPRLLKIQFIAYHYNVACLPFTSAFYVVRAASAKYSLLAGT